MSVWPKGLLTRLMVNAQPEEEDTNRHRGETREQSLAKTRAQRLRKHKRQLAKKARKK